MKPPRTPLGVMFEAIALPLDDLKERVQLRVWHAAEPGTGWRASWGIGGSVGGVGATPEDAIVNAHNNYITLRDRNRPQGAGTKTKAARRAKP